MDKDIHRANILINKGAAFFSKGDVASAVKNFLKAVKDNPNSIEAHFNLGLCYQKEKKKDKAIKHFEKVLTLNPLDFEALNNLGNLYLAKGKSAKAIASYKKAVKINPNLAEGFYNLGVRYQELGANHKAINYYNKSLNIDPNNERTLNNLAIAYKKTGNIRLAVQSFKKALEVNPKLHMALSNLGALILFYEPNEAIGYLTRATEVNPSSAETFYNLGVAYQTQGKLEEALKAFKKVVKLNPKFEHVYGQLYQKYRALVYWKEAEKVLVKMDKLTKKALSEDRIPPETPFISVSTYQDPKRNLAVASVWSKFDKETSANIPFKPKYTIKVNKKKINIGYLSYDFHDHATMHLISGLLRLHNKKRFNIFAYSYGPRPKKEDKYRSFARRYTQFRDVRQLSDLEVAKLIQKDKIDILVDLKGHTSGCRLGILAFKPAPIQATWLGFPGTTGADYIDYLIADKIVVPKSDAKYYTEKIIYLPDAYQPTDNQQIISERRFKRQEFGLPAQDLEGGGIVFSSFNQPYKIDSNVFDVWMRILAAVPKSILWLWEGNPKAILNYQKETQKRGICPSRLLFTGILPKNEHLARIALSDIALDTFTYNGHTTTSDCLWAGVPVITLKGNHFASRVSASLLSAIGLPELIATSSKEYEFLAIKLAKNPKKLIRLKAKLQKNRLTKPLFDTQRFTSNLEKVYETIWRNFETSA